MVYSTYCKVITNFENPQVFKGKKCLETTMMLSPVVMRHVLRKNH